jgi:uncharacterized protein YdhG (YjbR/CyaY superfamily)
MPPAPTTIDEYLATLPDDARAILERVRAALRAALPDAEERIRYGMPALMLDERYAIHFAGWKSHVGLYPVTRLDGPLEAEIAPYRAKKDSLRFPYAQPIPYALIERLAAALHAVRRAAPGPGAPSAGG